MESNEMLNSWESKFLAPINVHIPAAAPISPSSGKILGSAKNDTPSLNYDPVSNMNSELMSPQFNMANDFQSLMSPPITPAEALTGHFTMPLSAHSLTNHTFDIATDSNTLNLSFDMSQGHNLNIVDPDYGNNDYRNGEQIVYHGGQNELDMNGFNSLQSPTYDGQHNYAWMAMDQYQNQSPTAQHSHNLPTLYSPGSYPTRLNPLQRVAGKQMKHSNSESSIASWSTNASAHSFGSNEWRATEPNFPCTFPGCQKVFTKQTNLKSHSRIHHTERNYSCQECGTSFRRSHDLKRHQRSLHSDVKPFGCGRCGKRFSRMDALKRHTSRITSACYVSPGFTE